MLRALTAFICLVLAFGWWPVADAHAAPTRGICDKLAKVAGNGKTVSGGRYRKCPPPNPPGSTKNKGNAPSKKRDCPILLRLPDGSCPTPPQGPGSLPHLPPTFNRIVPIEQSVVAALTLPDATPRFGPDPSVNEWNMLVVGFPIWLWTDGPRQMSTHVRHDGLDFTITATWQSSRLRMGDGESVVCGAMTEYRQDVDVPGRESPTCGYIYERVSPKGRPYLVVAEQTWRVDWVSGGDHGSFLHTYQGSRTLEIGELSSLING